MAFSAIVRRVLISCPGDVPETDLAIVSKTINRWNALYGDQFGATVLPISWGEHAAAQFGDHPQSIINTQLVDECDGCIAIFANRLGTATEVAESGTAEEIERLADAGRYVAVLRSVRRVDASRLDLSQAVRLEEYIKKISNNALILAYSTDADLARHVDAILMNAITRDQTQAKIGLATSARQAAEVWPHVEARERPEFGDGWRHFRNWYLVLHNTGSAPARNVNFRLDQDWSAVGRVPEGPDLPILAPNSETRFLLTPGTSDEMQALCTVTWEDDRGTQENSATLRLI